MQLIKAYKSIKLITGPKSPCYQNYANGRKDLYPVCVVGAQPITVYTPDKQKDLGIEHEELSYS